MIAVKDLSHRYGQRWALARITFDIPQGNCLGLLGPNGAGKTTLLRILATLISPTSGEVKIDDISLRTRPLEARRRIGLVAHKPLLYPHLTALENLEFYGRLYHVFNRRKRAEYLLNRIGLWHKRDERVRDLSYGQTRRVEIVRSLMHNPAVLLLDEPYSGLDLIATKHLDELLSELTSAGHTLIMTTHDLDHGVTHSDWLFILVGGRLIYQAQSSTISSQQLETIYAEAFTRNRTDD